MKKFSKKIQDTQIDMQDTRLEDSISLRKKAEELIYKANDDIKIILKTKEDLLNQINALTVRLNKTEGALQILKILLEK